MLQANVKDNFALHNNKITLTVASMLSPALVRGNKIAIACIIVLIFTIQNSGIFVND